MSAKYVARSGILRFVYDDFQSIMPTFQSVVSTSHVLLPAWIRVSIALKSRSD